MAISSIFFFFFIKYIYFWGVVKESEWKGQGERGQAKGTVGFRMTSTHTHTMRVFINKLYIAYKEIHAGKFIRIVLCIKKVYAIYLYDMKVEHKCI